MVREFSGQRSLADAERVRQEQEAENAEIMRLGGGDFEKGWNIKAGLANAAQEDAA